MTLLSIFISSFTSTEQNNTNINSIMAENKQAPPSTKMSAIPPSPLKILREDSVDGTLSPVSSKSTGTDTDTDTRKKVMMMTFVSLICVH